VNWQTVSWLVVKDGEEAFGQVEVCRTGELAESILKLLVDITAFVVGRMVSITQCIDGES